LRSRLPAAVLAVLVAMVLVAASLRWRARAPVAPSLPVSVRTPAASSSGADAGRVPWPTPAASVDAPHGARMLHGEARHTHRAAGTAPTRQPAVVWARDVGGPVEAQVTTSPDGQTLYAASLGGSLTAIARADGAVKWKLDLGDRAYATPCVAPDGTIYAGSDAKKVVAVSPEGKVRWSLDTDGDADTGPALAADGTVVFAAGRMVYGVTPLGFVRWRFAARRKVYTSPAIAADGRVFFGSQDHHAYALTPEGGALWSVDLGADVDGAPVVGDDGAVFFGTDAGEVVRVEAAGGRIAWRAKLGGFVRGTLSLARGGDVLAGVYGPAPRQVRLDPATGALRWSFAVQGTGAREFGVHGGALEDDAGLLLFGAQDDVVYAIDGSGTIAWRFTTGGDVDAPVTLLGDGTLVVGSDDGKVTLLRAE
jgi:outer membrane protein assembly factor BamB